MNHNEACVLQRAPKTDRPRKLDEFGCYGMELLLLSFGNALSSNTSVKHECTTFV